jgi:hypothetical protein
MATRKQPPQKPVIQKRSAARGQQAAAVASHPLAVSGSAPTSAVGVKEDESRAAAAAVRVKIWAQDPLVPPGLVEIDIPNADLETGPKDSQFAVRDHDLSSGVTYEQAKFSREQNLFEALEPEDIRFHQINAYATARYALNMIEDAIGRQVHWAFGPQLLIHPHYMQARNAFYSRDLGALAFFYFDIPFKQGKVFTCLSHDIVAHELGHAALDGLKPLFLEAMHSETGAFHESFGDLTAMFSALTLPAVVEQVLAATHGDLRQPSIASLLAEEFGYGIYGPGHFFLRNAGDPITMDTVPSFEVHAFSVLLTATLYEILTEFYEANRGTVLVVQGTGSDGLFLRSGASQSHAILGLMPEGTRVKPLGETASDGKRQWMLVRTPQFGDGWAAVDYLAPAGEPLSDTEALIEATRHLRRIAYRAINYLPPSSVTFRRFGQAMIAADKRVFPVDDHGYRSIIKRIFAQRRIVNHPEELETFPQIQLHWDGETDQRGLYQFIYRNRERLGIPNDPSFRLNYPTIHTIDHTKMAAVGAAPVREVIIEYTYTQEVRIFDLCSYFVNFGGTLVFDDRLQLVAHFAEPEAPGGQGAMIDKGLAFYQELRQRDQIRALTWRRPDARPTDAAYLLYRLPDGTGKVRLNVCSRFSAKSLDFPTRRTVRIDLPDMEDGAEAATRL